MTPPPRLPPSGADGPRGGSFDPAVHAEPTGPDPAWSGHAVQFYEAAPFLLDEVRRYVGVGLVRGEAAVVIAAPEHREGLEARLTAAGLDLEDARARGR